MLRLAELEFRCDGDRLFVEYGAESEGEKSAHKAQGTAVHASGFRGSIEELEVAFGNMSGYKGVLVGESRPMTLTDLQVGCLSV